MSKKKPSWRSPLLTHHLKPAQMERLRRALMRAELDLSVELLKYMQNEPWWEDTFCKIAADVNSQWYRDEFLKLINEASRRERDKWLTEIQRIQAQLPLEGDARYLIAVLIDEMET